MDIGPEKSREWRKASACFSKISDSLSIPTKFEWECDATANGEDTVRCKQRANKSEQ